MANIINIGLRGLQFLMTLLVLALVGDVISNAKSGNPSIVNYDIFTAIFGALTLLYLIPASIKESLQIHSMLPLILDALNVLFWFCAAVATAAELGVHSCDNKSYLKHNKVTNGAANKSKRCTEMQASTAFLFFGFAAFLGSLVFSAMGSGGGANLRPSRIGRGPAMSQV